MNQPPHAYIRHHNQRTRHPRRYLQKPSYQEAETSGAFLPSNPDGEETPENGSGNPKPEVAIDSGVVVFAGAATWALARLAYSETFKGCTARGVAQGACALRLELYSDLLLALKTGAPGEEVEGTRYLRWFLGAHSGRVSIFICLNARPRQPSVLATALKYVCKCFFRLESVVVGCRTWETTGFHLHLPNAGGWLPHVVPRCFSCVYRDRSGVITLSLPVSKSALVIHTSMP